MQGQISVSGALTAEHHKTGARPAPLSWKLRNNLTNRYISGWITRKLAHVFTELTGAPVMVAELRAVHNKANGEKVDYGVISRKVVTTAFVDFVVDQLQTETSVFGDFKYHDSGVGTTAENIADTGIETTDGESRATGTQVENAHNIYESVGTINYTSTKAITEHGLFNDASAGTLMDRSVFSAINVVSGDSVSFTYRLTLTAGS